MVELLKQGVYKPLDVVDEVLVIYAGTRGHLDKVPVNRVQEWEKKFLHVHADQKPEIRKAIAETKDLTDDIDPADRSGARRSSTRSTSSSMSEEEARARVARR